jgi:hypothetical protein
MTPAYLKTFRRAVEELEGRAKSALSAKRVVLNTLNALNTHPSTLLKPYADDLAALEARCPDYIDPNRWQQCVNDARHFLATWGEMAATLGWSSRELFGLHQVPLQPAATYQRLSRYDATGLIWLLQGHPVVALTKDEAAIQRNGSVVVYGKERKPAFGPVGDSLDDIGPNIGEKPR